MRKVLVAAVLAAAIALATWGGIASGQTGQNRPPASTIPSMRTPVPAPQHVGGAPPGLQPNPGGRPGDVAPNLTSLTRGPSVNGCAPLYNGDGLQVGVACE
jgi:hypothetical protein